MLLHLTYLIEWFKFKILNEFKFFGSKLENGFEIKEKEKKKGKIKEFKKVVKIIFGKTY